MASAEPTVPAARTAAWVALAVPVVAGLAASLVAGLYAGLHRPRPAADLSMFANPLLAKAWISTAAVGLALVQVVTGAGVLGRLGPRLAAARWPAVVHRWSGRLAVLVLLPVIAHCLFALGFGLESPRVLVHSVAGCAFFGAFVAKMLLLPRREAPAWALPVIGAVVAVALVAAWLTSALWFFRAVGLG